MNGTELPAGPTQLRLACQHAHGRGCFWGCVPAMGQVCGCSVDLSLQSPDTMLGWGWGGGQLSARLPGPPCPHFHCRSGSRDGARGERQAVGLISYLR